MSLRIIELSVAASPILTMYRSDRYILNFYIRSRSTSYLVSSISSVKKIPPRSRREKIISTFSQPSDPPNLETALPCNDMFQIRKSDSFVHFR